MSAPLVADPSFGACRFRIPLGGRRAIWEVTNACNYGCRYCIFASTTRVPPGELGRERALGVVDELAAAGFTHVKFTGGEPFLRADMVDILAAARRAGLSCDVSTNASRIDPATAEALSGLGLDMVHVSLDGPDAASHEAVRGKGTFAPTLEGLGHLLAHGVPVRVGCVVHARNDARLGEMAELCAGLGVGSLVISRMEPVGRMRDRASLLSGLSDDEIRSIASNACAAMAGRMSVSHNLDRPVQGGCRSCPGGDRFVFIDHKGRVSPCTWVSEHRPDLVPETSLADVPLAAALAHPRMASYRRLASTYSMSGAGPGGCPMAVPAILRAVESSGPPAPSRFGPGTRIYPFATENLAYVPLVVSPGDSVMALGGSGDHVIAACAAGASDVMAVDVNDRARLWGLAKVGALLALPFERYLAFLSQGPGALDAGTLSACAGAMGPEAHAFVAALLARHGGDGAAARASDAFHLRHDHPATVRRNVPYLRDEGAYEVTRTAVSRARLEWVTADIRDVAAEGRALGRDVILLSNLPEHSHGLYGGDHVHAFRDRVVLPLLAATAPRGRLAMYAFDAGDLRGSSARNPYGSQDVRDEAYGTLPGTSTGGIRVPSAFVDALPGEEDIATVLRRVSDA